MPRPTHAEAIRAKDIYKIGYREYLDDYYSGTLVRVYFDGIWVDDIITIQWDAVNNKAPVYGYASQHFDAVLNGTFIVNGSFTIAFKEVGYLYTILERIRQLNHSTRAALNKSSSSLASRLQTNSDFNPFTYDGETSRVKYQTIEELLSGSLDKSFSDFENVAEVLEDTLLGVVGNPVDRGQNRIPRADEMDRLGDVFNVSRIGTGFNILVGYGDLNAPISEHTVHTISDVHITGVGQVVAPTGEPVAEQYRFFARNIDESIPRRYRKPAPPSKSAEEKSKDELSKRVGDAAQREEDQQKGQSDAAPATITPGFNDKPQSELVKESNVAQLRVRVSKGFSVIKDSSSTENNVETIVYTLRVLERGKFFDTSRLAITGDNVENYRITSVSGDWKRATVNVEFRPAPATGDLTFHAPLKMEGDPTVQFKNETVSAQPRTRSVRYRKSPSQSSSGGGGAGGF